MRLEIFLKSKIVGLLIRLAMIVQQYEGGRIRLFPQSYLTSTLGLGNFACQLYWPQA